MKDVFFLTPPGPHQDKNAADNSGFAHCNPFIRGGDAEPSPALFFQNARALGIAVPVGIAFHDGADGYRFADMLLQKAKIVPQR